MHDGTALAAGLLGQLDLVGNLLEWNLDYNARYANPCTDSTLLKDGSGRVIRGGYFRNSSVSNLDSSYRNEGIYATDRSLASGFRCARTPVSNQMPASEMTYNYARDFSMSKWADYDINSLYMYEGTDGYTVQHNLLLNSPNIVHQNKNGSHMVVSDNGPHPSGADTTQTSASIKPAYADIKNLTIPAARF